MDQYGQRTGQPGKMWIRDRLKWGRFLKDLALGTGSGLRYDLTFLVIRLDWGIGLHVPYDTGKKGYYNIPVSYTHL